MTAPPGYRYLRHLGAGGFGEVHLVEHVATGRPAAVKYIQQHVLADPEAVARFRREAQVLAATDVPTAVRVYDLDTSSDPAFLLMEYVPGVTLWDLMVAAPLPARQALPILHDVAAALTTMSERNVVHRDIKPSNVFVLPDGRAKLGDFGLARAMLPDDGFRTVGAPSGTPAYFPPEVSSGAAEATAESDAYSFAVMAYEVLTGSLPITAPDAVSLITAHWTQEPRPVTDVVRDFPVAAGEVLMQALAKDPRRRPLPGEVMAALEALPASAWSSNVRPDVAVPDAPDLEAAWSTPTDGSAAPVTVAARDPGLPQGSRAAAPTTTVAPSPGPRADRSRHAGGRRRGTVASAIAVIALLVAAIGWELTEGREAPAGAATTAPSSFAVRSVAVTADPQTSRCPRAQVRLVAVVTTNGADGEFVLAWRLPDGSAGPRQSFAPAVGQTRVRAHLDLSLAGTRSITGRAVVTVRPSGERAGTVVRYVCPR